MNFGPAYDQKFLLEVFRLQDQIENLKSNYSLADICFAPLREKGDTDGRKCLIQSPAGYLDDHEEIDYEELFKCTQNQFACLAPYGGPIEPAVVFGGFLVPGEDISKRPKFERANSVILTFLVNNHYNKTLLEPALDWEKAFVAFMQNYTKHMDKDLMDLAFTSERSIQDELYRESQSDVLTILVSYLIMFIYIAISLGHVEVFKRILIDSKITLGLGGVIIVLASVVCSVGIFGYIGLPATLIIVEVIPFLVLAVGVDNIFIMVQTHQRYPKKPNETSAEHIGRTLGKVGPSVLLTAVSESCCFFLGGLSDMPAVKAFALYAGMALLIDFLLQITCFVSLLSLDAIRQAENRFDIFCFIRGKKTDALPNAEGALYKFFKVLYVPFLMQRKVRIFVMIVFFGWLCASISVAPHIDVGLNQELSMPEDSFVLKYFHYLKDYLNIGPPMYFVLKPGLDLRKPSHQNMVCGGQHCNVDSLSTQIFLASRRSNVTYISKSPSSWLDDYIDWSSNTGCCYFNPEDDEQMCYRSDLALNCTKCDIPLDAIKRPVHSAFNQFVPHFLADVPDIGCGKGGHAAYSQAVRVNPVDHSVGASYFMGYHTVLKTSSDYFEALRSARAVAHNITRTIQARLRMEGESEERVQQIEVFPYSVFYVFYEQYLTMWPDTLKSMVSGGGKCVEGEGISDCSFRITKASNSLGLFGDFWNSNVKQRKFLNFFYEF